MNDSHINLIGNCCVSAFIYELNNIQFNNPFIWSFINPQSYKNIILNYNSIPTSKISLSEVSNNDRTYYRVRISPDIDIDYIHYIYSPNHSTPVSDGRNVLYRYAYKYTVDKYIKRLNRMITSRILPSFLILDGLPECDYQLNDLLAIISIIGKYKLCIISKYSELLTYNSNHIKIIYDNHPRNNNGWYTEQYARHYNNEIMKFLL